MERVELIALIGSVVWLVLLFELVRERKLSEGYSLIWLLSGFSLLVLALWRELLDFLAHTLGIYYPPSAFIVVVLGFVFLLLLQQSLWICQLREQNRILAQKLGMITSEFNKIPKHCAEDKHYNEN